MPEFLKRKGFGGLQSCAYYDVDLTEVRLTADEWYRFDNEKASIYNRVRALEKELSDTKSHLQNAFEAGQGFVAENEALKKQISGLESAAGSLRSKAERAESALSEARKVNQTRYQGKVLLSKEEHNDLLSCKKQLDTILKITRERANRDRDIRPRKKRSGYLFLSTQEKYNAREKLSIWKTSLQTPYGFDFGCQIKELVRSDFDNLDLWKKLGLRRFKYLEFRFDKKSGFWIVIISHYDVCERLDDDLISEQKQTVK